MYMHPTRGVEGLQEFGYRSGKSSNNSSDMNKKSRCLFIILFMVGTLLSQLSFSQIKTIHFEQLDSLLKAEKKPVVVFLHTSWCKYCSTMKNTTFLNEEVVKLLNQKFYFVSLNIEEKSNIFFRGHTFRYKPTGTTTGVHELAEQLGSVNGELAYPTTCFLNADCEIIYRREGYIQPKELLNILESL